MKSVFARLGKVLSGGHTRQPKTRRTAEEAVQIASAYATTHGLDLFRVHLVTQDVREVEGKVVWTLRTPTVGQWLTIGVDDATGEVVGHHVHGVR
jgi:hypothetical protein